jgi:hypothetical protein
MISSASPHQRTILFTLLGGAAIIALLWVLAISPKRSESATVRENVAAQQQRLDTARTQLASYDTARKQYPRHLAALKRLDKAVPGRGEISTLLRQLQRRASASHSDLRLAALKPGTAAAAPAAAPAAGTTAAATTAPASTLTPGATPGAGGLATLPFTFNYTGKYFDLVNVLKAARRSVTVRAGHLKIDGRLVTIEGLSFARPDIASPLITATVSGTAYIADAPATPTPAVTAATTTQGGS